MLKGPRLRQTYPLTVLPVFVGSIDVVLQLKYPMYSRETDHHLLWRAACLFVTVTATTQYLRHLMAKDKKIIDFRRNGYDKN